MLKNLLLLKELLIAQKEIIKQELNEKPDLKNYLLQFESTINRLNDEFNVLKNIYIKHDYIDSPKYPQKIRFSDGQLELIQKIHGGEYIMTSKELPQIKDSYNKINKHTTQASVELKVNHKQKLSDKASDRRHLFTVQNNNIEYGKETTILNDELRLNVYHDEFKPDDSEQYNMSLRCIKSGLGIKEKIRINFTGAGAQRIKEFIKQMDTLRNLILSSKQDTISFQPDTPDSMFEHIKEVIRENAEAYQNPKYSDDSTYYNEYWAVTDNINSDAPLVLHKGIHYNID